LFANSNERLNNIVEYVIMCHSLTLNYVQWKKKERKTLRSKSVQVSGIYSKVSELKMAAKIR